MAKKHLTDLERFHWRYVIVDDTGCWQSLKLDKDGYGTPFKIGSRKDGTRRDVRGHRWIYEQLVGPIPEGYTIDHLCRNRACVNPSHLEPVTAVENTKRGIRATTKVCKYGHELSGHNLIITSVGKRRCRICSNKYSAWYQRKTGHNYSKLYREKRKARAD